MSYDGYLFEIDAPNFDEIKTAKRAILQALREKEGQKIEILFSGGKDSLLVALLTAEVIQENNLTDADVSIHTDLTGYEQNGGRYEREILKSVGSVFDVEAFAPPPLRRYSVQVLGLGLQPLNSYHFRDCTTKWKNRLAPKSGLYFSGVRKDESRKRKIDYKDTSPFKWFPKQSIITLAPCVDVTTSTTWAYLKANVYKIGVDIGFVLDAYSTEARHGCWCCFWRDKNALPPFERDVNRLARYWGKWYLENRSHLNRPPYRPKPQRPRATLKYKRIIYDQVRELEDRYNVKYIKPLSDKLIKEIWNLQETYLTLGPDNELDPWNVIFFNDFVKVKDDYLNNYALDPSLYNVCFEPSPFRKDPSAFRCIQRKPELFIKSGKIITFDD